MDSTPPIRGKDAWIPPPEGMERTKKIPLNPSDGGGFIYLNDIGSLTSTSRIVSLEIQCNGIGDHGEIVIV
jgi:hypothetical protein